MTDQIVAEVPIETTNSGLNSRVAAVKAKAVESIAKPARAASDAIVRRADETAKASVDAMTGNPLTAIAGAVAIGAVAAALIPASQREIKNIGPISNRIRQAADKALRAAHAAGSGELSAAGLTLTAASSGLSGVLTTLLKAALTASSAAKDTVKQERQAATQNLSI